MADDDLFQGLPPPSSAAAADADAEANCGHREAASSPVAPKASPPAPPPLKSALKRDKPPEAPPQEPARKRLRFKTTVDATETQIIEATKRIASHIKNPSKFSKASKLALQLIQAGSVKPETSSYFFAILEAAMSSPSTCTEQSVRLDYHALFSAAQDAGEYFNEYQKNQLATWTIYAVIANDLYTDDSFVFSKAAGKIKEAISRLPVATTDDDNDEADALANSENGVVVADSGDLESAPSTTLLEVNEEISDPFGLDALLPSSSRKDDIARGREVAALNQRAEEDESKRFVKSQREALLLCLEIAARRYKLAWCQTVIDILVKHAFDNVKRFTARQRDAIEKLWASIREQLIRRKQGKSVSGKLDVNAFERLQEKYAREKISIRHAVGGGGDRRAQQWLG